MGQYVMKPPATVDAVQYTPDMCKANKTLMRFEIDSRKIPDWLNYFIGKNLVKVGPAIDYIIDQKAPLPKLTLVNRSAEHVIVCGTDWFVRFPDGTVQIFSDSCFSHVFSAISLNITELPEPEVSA